MLVTSGVSDSATLWTVASQALLSMGFSMPSFRESSELSLLCLLNWQAGSLPLEPPWKPWGTGGVKILRGSHPDVYQDVYPSHVPRSQISQTRPQRANLPQFRILLFKSLLFWILNPHFVFSFLCSSTVGMGASFCFNFYWNIVALQWCVWFYYIGKWVSYTIVQGALISALWWPKWEGNPKKDERLLRSYAIGPLAFMISVSFQL